MSEWLAVEAIVRQRDKEKQASAIAKLSSESMSSEQVPAQIQRDLSNDVTNPKILKHQLNNTFQVFEDISDDESIDDQSESTPEAGKKRPRKTKQNTIKYESDEENQDPNAELINGECNEPAELEQEEEEEVNEEQLKDFIHNVIVTNASVDMSNLGNESPRRNNLDAVTEENNSSLDTCIETHGLASPARSACVSPASSNGGVYSVSSTITQHQKVVAKGLQQELLETFGLNLHRIEKDVQRCDRNYWYFAGDNLDKLRNVMCTYVWEHLEVGYVQGMCDLAAPLLVIFNDESLTYACFCHLMERMVENFSSGNAMDCHFANMRSLIQILG